MPPADLFHPPYGAVRCETIGAGIGIGIAIDIAQDQASIAAYVGWRFRIPMQIATPIPIPTARISVFR